jgi:hypothetical protein
MYHIHKPAAEEGELRVYEEPQTHTHIYNYKYRVFQEKR